MFGVTYIPTETLLIIMPYHANFASLGRTFAFARTIMLMLALAVTLMRTGVRADAAVVHGQVSIQSTAQSRIASSIQSTTQSITQSTDLAHRTVDKMCSDLAH